MCHQKRYVIRKALRAFKKQSACKKQQATPLLTLTCSKPRIGFVKDVNTTFAAHQPIVAVTCFECFERIFNFHNNHRL